MGSWIVAEASFSAVGAQEWSSNRERAPEGRRGACAHPRRCRDDRNGGSVVLSEAAICAALRKLAETEDEGGTFLAMVHGEVRWRTECNAGDWRKRAEPFGKEPGGSLDLFKQPDSSTTF